MNLIFTGRVVKGELDNLDYKKYLKSMEGKRLKCSIGKYKPTRSNQQNRYWWGVVVSMIANHLGYEVYEHYDVHYELRRLFLSQPDKPLQIPKSTTKLTTEEFNNLIEHTQIWASKTLGMIIPDPNEIEIKKEDL